MRVKNLIVGAGLSGAVLAERLASQLNEEVVVIDKRDHIGGNCFDYVNSDNNYIQQYGPHIFHTKIESVWKYLSQFTEWKIFMLKVQACIEGNLVNLPFNLNSLYQVFPPMLSKKLEEKLVNHFQYNQNVPIFDLLKTDDDDLKFLADYIYDKVFLGYTMKQWGTTPEELDQSVFRRVPISISRDDRYFQDQYQAIPKYGYTKMIGKMLSHPNVSVLLNKSFLEAREEMDFERVFYTGPIDEYFEYCYGELPYRSLVFEMEKLDIPSFQRMAVVSYPTNFDFTRITEHKKFLDENPIDSTVISYEFPCQFENGKNERYYPIPNSNNQELYDRYLEKAKQLNNVYFIGRLGDYRYYNMDLVVDRTLNFFVESILKEYI